MSPMVGHRKCPKNSRLSKHKDMTILWKAVEEHFLMVFDFRFNHFPGENAFSEFFLKKPQPLTLPLAIEDF
jgi:hypothetical protein